MAHQVNDSEPVMGSQEQFEALLQEHLRQAVRVALVRVLEAEVDAFIGVLPYQRSEQRRDHRNGHYRRHLETSVGQISDLPVPRTRGGYHTQLFERDPRRRDELDQAIRQMFIQGLSTRQVGQVMETLTGSKPSASTVSRVFHSLEAEYAHWKTRRWQERYAYAFADGTYFTMISNQEGCKMPVLAVIGIRTTGEGELLTFSVGDRENQPAWEELLENLKQRGVKGVSLWISDGNQAMLNAIPKKFPTAARQRCVVHKMDNVLSYIPNKQQDQIKAELQAWFYQKDR